MSDFSNYLHRATETKRAYAEFNAASLALELAQIKERLAKIKSQHDPIEALLREKLSERDRLYAIAHYVVVGRMPS